MEEKYYFSIVDVVQVLTEQSDYQTARKYWNKLKQRLKEEGFETVTNCHQLKMPAADGKMRATDVADTEQLLRIVQSIPSKTPRRRNCHKESDRTVSQIARGEAIRPRLLSLIVTSILLCGFFVPSAILVSTMLGSHSMARRLEILRSRW